MKIKDKRLFELAREFLCTYLPLQKTASPCTVKAYRESLNMLFTFAAQRGSKPLSEVTFDDLSAEGITAFLDWLATERGCSNQTANNRLSATKSFLKYAGWRDPVCNAVYLAAYGIPYRKVEKRLDVDHFGDTELDAILAQPDTSTRIGHRDWFFMVLMYDTGARIGEILGLAPSDVRVSIGTSSITLRGKGHKVRVVPILDETATQFESYMKRFHGDTPAQAPLFYTTQHGVVRPMSNDNAARIVAKHANAARVTCPTIPDRVTPHMFRHSRALGLYRSGVPLPLVSEWLGHVNLETTLVYAYADVEMKRHAIEKATGKHHPLRNIILNESIGELDDDAFRRLCGLLI